MWIIYSVSGQNFLKDNFKMCYAFSQQCIHDKVQNHHNVWTEPAEL